MSRLRELREAKSITRTQLAAAVGVSERYIYFMESGKRNPSMKVAGAVASILDSSVDYIFLSSESTFSTCSPHNKGLHTSIESG